MERETGLEPATSSLGSWHSTTELLPRSFVFRYLTVQQGFGRFPGESILSLQSIQNHGVGSSSDEPPLFDPDPSHNTIKISQLAINWSRCLSLPVANAR